MPRRTAPRRRRAASPRDRTPEAQILRRDNYNPATSPSGHTVVRMNTSSLEKKEHDREAVNPYVEQDLRDSVKVDLYQWIKGAYGVSRDRIDEWTRQIGEQKWFHDATIARYLKEYCSTRGEPARYEPFCGLANRIVELARGNLTGIPQRKSYPIDSVEFINTARTMVSRIPEHGELGAERYLDITLTHGEAAKKFKETTNIEWVDVLQYIELKFAKQMKHDLKAEIKSRGLTMEQSDKSPSASGPRSKSSKRSSKTSSERKDVQISNKRKRKREPEDPISALDLGSSCAKKKSSEFSKYQGKLAAIQAGAYALEVLSCTYGTRVCCQGLVLKDDRLFPWYYDACGIVYSDQYLSLIQDFEKTAAIIIALVSCTPERFGTLPTSIMKSPTSYLKTFPHDLTGNVLRVQHPVTHKEIKITLKDSLYAQYVLAGRRTFAYKMKASPQLSKENLMVKFSYQVNTRRPEHEFITMARKAGIEHLPKVHMWSDLWKMSDGARRVFFADNEGEITYEDRTLRMIIYTEYGSIKTLFRKRLDLMPTMVEQLVNCLHDLRYKVNILHRDVSVNNIMFEKRGENYIFILNDFDMATVIPADDGSPYTPSARHRTGTLPFMACQLLRDAYLRGNSSEWISTRHLLWYDYESLFWVCLWCILALFLDCLSERQRKANLKVLKSWEDSELETACGRKFLLCTNLLQDSSVARPPASLPLLKWFNGWTSLLQDAYGTINKQSRKEQPGVASKVGFDPDTVGGVMSKDNILKVLAPLASPSQAGPPQISETPIAPKRRSRRQEISVEAQAVKAAIMSRLRPRKTA